MAKQADLVKFVQSSFKKLANKQKSIEMQAYMKTTMPFYGVQKPDRMPIYKAVKKDFGASDIDEYKDSIRALWALPHREEKYTALEYALIHKQFITAESLDLYEELIRDGAWWDFVDTIAVHLVGEALLHERKNVKAILDKWINDQDMWIRRTAILSQNKHKANTDEKMLFKYIERRMHEREFFIAKAIGWALREYSYTNPKSVKQFIAKNKSELAPLSVREGSKRL